MNKLFLFVSLMLVAVSAVASESVNYFGCTLDHHPAVLHTSMADNTPSRVVDSIRTGFEQAAAVLHDEELVAAKGWQTFANNITDEDLSFIDELVAPQIDPHAMCVIK